MSKRRKLTDLILKVLIWLFSLITVGFLAGMVIYIVSRGISGISWEFITGNYNLYKGETGILPMIVGTLLLIFTTIIIAVPVGVFAAIYLTEYAKQGLFVKIIRFGTESLAGIPSIIYGLFGYIFFKNTLNLGFSVMSGALTLSIMVLPIIVRTTEEALLSVDPGYREGSLALGATRLQTIFKVVLPSAMPGILTAVILSMGRVIGETAAVIYTVGSVARIPAFDKLLTSSVRTLSVHLYMVALEEADFVSAFATGTILMIIIAALNFAANRLTRRFINGRTKGLGPTI
ncbi:MAG: phosphate ABC transporter permease PstA [Clostridiaceae bacterium]|nr:phosphate ABC transporter permease PstA [Clostridiaceae bacterium]